MVSAIDKAEENAASFMLQVLRMTGDTLAEFSVTPDQKVHEVKRELEGPSQTPAAFGVFYMKGVY